MSCTLCGSSLPHHPIIDIDTSFCCHGCHAVFQILSAKNALDNITEHPIFKQAVRAGLISNPELLNELKNKQNIAPEKTTEKLHLEIGEMWCPSCAELIRLVFLREKGVTRCVVDYSTDLAVIEFSPFDISKDRIKSIIRALGYVPLALDTPEQQKISSRLYLRFIIAAFCSLNVMMLAYPLYATYFNFDDQGYGSLFAWLSMVISLPVATYCAWPVYTRAYAAAKVGIIGMEALVSLGVLSAFAFSLVDLLSGGTLVYFDSMTVVVVFVLLGKIIETRAKFSAKSTIMRLHKGIPKRGRMQVGENRWEYTLAKDIPTGAVIQVLMGEKIVLDGIVRKGSGTCDESLMTGESMPVVKEEGSRVLAGAILQNGYLEVEVIATQDETTLSRILHMVENDLGNKSAYTRAVDPWVKVFVPIVCVFAAFVFISTLHLGVDVAATRLMAILLISCPCAIGIAAPLAESHLMHALAGLGAIIRNRGVLNYLGRESIYVFDKTGTITYGKYEVLTDLDALTDHQKGILKGMTARSNHPTAKAVANALDVVPLELELVEEFAGKGMRALFQGRMYFLGSSNFLVQNGFEIAKRTTSTTTVYFGCDQNIIAAIELGDKLREEAPQTIQELAPMRTMLLSGDSRAVVENIAKKCQFGAWQSEVTPLDKREMIEQLKKDGTIVCMVGDGINDAPALTAAHIGISVLAAADISVQVSDILLTTDKLLVIPTLGRLAKKARRIIQQNLFWAFFYNIVGVGLAAMGWLSPIFAAAAMVISSLMVLFNAQRLSGAGLGELKDPQQK